MQPAAKMSGWTLTMAGCQSTAAGSASENRISIVSAPPDAVKSLVRLGVRRAEFAAQCKNRGAFYQGASCGRSRFEVGGAAKSLSRLVLRRRRRLLACPRISTSSESSALHLREGWIRGEERRGRRMSDVGQLVGRCPETRICVRLLQQ